MDQQYAELIFDRPVHRFLQRFFLSNTAMQSLILISPIMTTLEGTRFSLARVCHKINHDRIPTYVITREPEEDFHEEAVKLLHTSDFTEVRFNPSLHAKLYICKQENGGFALLGSGNLTRSSIERNIEIGIIIRDRGQGRELFHELFYWGVVRLRTLAESKLVKRMTYVRRM